jgi:hypothetical protein
VDIARARSPLRRRQKIQQARFEYTKKRSDKVAADTALANPAGAARMT